VILIRERTLSVCLHSDSIISLAYEKSDFLYGKPLNVQNFLNDMTTPVSRLKAGIRSHPIVDSEVDVSCSEKKHSGDNYADSS